MKKETNFLIGIIIPIITIIGSIVYFSFKGNACPFQGCKLAANLLNFPEIYLEIAGLFYFISLFFVRKFMQQEYYRFYLITGILFEVTIYSYEIVHHVFCPLCTVIVFSLLYLGFLEFSIYILSLVAIPIGLSILTTPINTIKDKIIFNQKYNLIYSITCPHCKKVEEFFNKHKIRYAKYAVENNKLEAVKFLKHFNFNNIPVLIIKLNNDKFLIIYGEDNIIDYIEKDTKKYFNKNKKTCITSKGKIFNFILNDSNNFLLNDKFQGCSLQGHCSK